MNDASLAKPDFQTWMAVIDRRQSYASALDQGDVELILENFDADALWTYGPNASCRGHAAIRAFFDERLSVFARTSHHVGPPVVRLAGGDAPISAMSYFLAEHLLADGSRYRVHGRYLDRLRIDAGVARICSRSVVVHVSRNTERSFTMLARKPAPARM